MSREHHAIATTVRIGLSIFVRATKNRRKTEMRTKSNRHGEQRADACGLLARVQQLADSRPDGGYTAEWMEETLRLGDITAVAVALRR